MAEVGIHGVCCVCGLVVEYWLILCVQVEAKLCDKCATAGVTSKLRLYQIHIDEAVLMCENEDVSSWTSLVSTSYSLVSQFLGSSRFAVINLFI
jgi:hypothetical protein